MRWVLSLLLIFSCSTRLHADDPVATEVQVKEQTQAQQDLIERLRQAGSESRLQALKDLQALPGYPDSARFAVPALIWIQDDDDMAVRSGVGGILKDMDWPHHIDVDSARAFIARQDLPYKMMAVKALGEMAMVEPEALLLLLQLCRGRNGPLADVAAAQGGVILNRPCPNADDAQAWSDKADLIANDFLIEISHHASRSRPLLAVLDSCGGWNPTLASAARDALKQNADPYLP
jgi:hypothetical protein